MRPLLLRGGRSAHIMTTTGRRSGVASTRGYTRPAPLASEYHERDYDYAEHLARVEPILQAQREAAARMPAEQRAVLPPPLPPLRDDEDDEDEDEEDDERAPCPPADDANNAWETFFREHSTARFFRERRYFPLAFPALARASSVLEIGAGAGAALLPVLRASRSSRVVATDVSASSLAQLRRAASEALGGEEEAGRRVSTAVADGAAETEAFVGAVERALLRRSRRREGDGDERGGRPAVAVRGAFDAVILAFTLSAVPPGDAMRRMLRNAAACLKPGTGVLCLRDHAVGDLVQLRIPPEQMVRGREREHTYVRGDGTLAHFFSPAELDRLAGEAGFEVAGTGGGDGPGERRQDQEPAQGRARVACVFNRNRRTGQELRRAFVTATFVRRREEGGGE
jgi:methyltransferase-like protein 6